MRIRGRDLFEELGYVFFDIGRISQFDFSITDGENFFNVKLIQKNWGTFTSIGSPFQKLETFFKDWGTFCSLILKKFPNF